MSNKFPNTLFNRVNYLRERIDKHKMKKLGQHVKDAFVGQYDKLPSKISLTITNHKGEPSVRTVAVYPDEFVPTIDAIIKKYSNEYRIKRKRIHTNSSNSRKTKAFTKR